MNLPGILTPDLGLFFWMAVAFIVVLLILSKFAFPIIVKMVDERQKFINDSLINARAANEQLATIQAEGEKILRSAHEEQAKILKDAMATRDAIVKDAQQKATAEGEKLLEEAKAQILVEKENALRDIRAQVADALPNSWLWNNLRTKTNRKTIFTESSTKSRPKKFCAI